MPIFEYVCDDCHARYEQIVMSAKQEIACPKWESKRHTLQLSVFSAGKSSNGAAASRASSAFGGCACTPTTCGCR
jgi:putative FmdB family regulatory protein